MFKFVDISLMNEEERNKILEVVYNNVPQTYAEYFKKYGKSRWPLEKLQQKVQGEYQLAVIGEESGDMAFYQAVSKPKHVGGRNCSKIGFTMFGEGVKDRRAIKRDGIRFLEREITQQPNQTLVVELPEDFVPIRRFYERDVEFQVSKDNDKTLAVLKAFGRDIKTFRGYSYITQNTPIYHCMLLKNL